MTSFELGLDIEKTNVKRELFKRKKKSEERDGDKIFNIEKTDN